MTMKLERLSLKHLLAAFLASTLLEALLAALVLLASVSVWYAVLAALGAISAIFGACTIHMTIQMKKLHL